MRQALSRDEYFGRTVSSITIGGFALCLTRYAKGDAIPWHTHAESYATVIVRGGYREYVSAGSRDCRPHDVVTHSRGEGHSDSFLSADTACLNVQGMEFGESRLLSGPGVSDLARKIVGEFRNPDCHSALAVEGLMLEILVASMRRGGGAAVPLWLADVSRLMEQRFNEPLSLAELAMHAGVHAAHVARAFRQHYGTTVGARLRDLRVAYVKQRLASAAPLQQIALDAGFSDQSHLTRTFRRATGITPAAFRRRLRCSARSRM
jgi:AraC family transcriptional regulator